MHRKQGLQGKEPGYAISWVKHNSKKNDWQKTKQKQQTAKNHMPVSPYIFFLIAVCPLLLLFLDGDIAIYQTYFPFFPHTAF